MKRLTPIRQAADYPNPDRDTAEALADLFRQLFPDNPDGRIDDGHDGLALAAHNPHLAARLADMSRFMALDLPWSHRQDLRELALQTINTCFDSDYSLRTRQSVAEGAGISEKQQAALPHWRESELFDEEQRLVIEYSEALARGPVPDELARRVVERFGEKGAVEFTAVAAFWGFWAMFLNGLRG